MIGRLLSLDPANLVVVGTIAFGYILHFTIRKKLSRESILLATALFTVILYPFLAWKEYQTTRKFIGDVIVAMVLWVFAVGVHKFILLPIREKLLKKMEAGKTEKAEGDDQTDTISKK